MYRLSGKLLYVLVRPFIRRYIQGTRRSYALLVRGNEVLLVRNWLGNGAWALPGGGAHAKETYPEAVAREVQEELGLSFGAADYIPLTHGVWSSNGFEFNYHCSYVVIEKTIQIHKQLLEITDALFMDIDEARGLPDIAPEIMEAISTLKASRSI